MFVPPYLLGRLVTMLTIALAGHWIARRISVTWMRRTVKVCTSLGIVLASAVLLPLLLMEVACSETLITSRAGEGSGVVRVRTFCGLGDCQVAVTVQKGLWSEDIIASQSDAFVNFAHVTWVPGSRTAVIFVDNAIGRSVRTAYDFRNSSVVPFEPLADVMRRSIIADYQVQPDNLVPYGGDVFQWTHYAGDGIVRPGPDAFRKRSKNR